MPDQRGLTIHFTDGTKTVAGLSAADAERSRRLLRLEDVLKNRYMLFEAESTLLLVPFENVKYLQLYPAPQNVPGHTYIKGASISG